MLTRRTIEEEYIKMTKINELDKTRKIALFIIDIILSIAFFASLGTTLSLLWNWFMPIIFNLPQLSTKHAIIVLFVLDFIKSIYTNVNEELTVEMLFSNAIKRIIYIPLFSIMIGYLMKLFLL